jgi:ABC-type branched-subunit amino acid transport system substrate-binding protein
LINKHGGNVYIFGYDYVWPHKLAEAILETVPEHGGKVVGKEFTPFGVKDFSPTLERIKESGAELLVLIQPGKDGFEFLNQFYDSENKDNVKILAIAASEDYLDALPAHILEGIYTGLHFFASLETKRAKDFVKRFQTKFGKEKIPTYSTESHYGSIKLLAAAIDDVGSLDKEKIIDTMEQKKFETGGGFASVRKDHHFNLPMFLAEFENGTLQVKKDFGIIVPGDQRVSVKPE